MVHRPGRERPLRAPGELTEGSDLPPESAGASAGRRAASAGRRAAARRGTAPTGRRTATGAAARRTSADACFPPGRVGGGTARVMHRRSGVRAGPGRRRSMAVPGTRAGRGRPHAEIVPGAAPRPAHHPGGHHDEHQYAHTRQHECDQHDVPLPPGLRTDCPQDAPRSGDPKRLLSKPRASRARPGPPGCGSCAASFRARRTYQTTTGDRRRRRGPSVIGRSVQGAGT